MRPHLSDPVALWAWAGYIALAVAYPWVYDVVAARTGHESMSRRALDLIHHPVWGPVVTGLYVGVFVGFWRHESMLGR